jgi:hypothetical protein
MWERDMTKISEHGFALDLPGDWKQIVSDEPGSLVYRETDGSGVVTVMLLAVRPVYAIADRTRLLGDYAQHRSTYEVGQAPGLEQSDPSFQDLGESLEATWSGVDRAADRRQRHRAVMSRGVLADFCFSTAGLDEAAFEERATLVLGSAMLSVEEPGAGE